MIETSIIIFLLSIIIIESINKYPSIRSHDLQGAQRRLDEALCEMGVDHVQMEKELVLRSELEGKYGIGYEQSSEWLEEVVYPNKLEHLITAMRREKEYKTSKIIDPVEFRKGILDKMRANPDYEKDIWEEVKTNKYLKDYYRPDYL